MRVYAGSNPVTPTNHPARWMKLATLKAQVSIEPGNTYSGGIHLSAGKIRRTCLALLVTRRQDASLHCTKCGCFGSLNNKGGSDGVESSLMVASRR